MFVKRFFEPKLAQTSYLIGCTVTGEAIVIDPNRDVDQYIEAARDQGVRVSHVTETHIHADFLSGSRELRAKTGATLYLSDEGDASCKYGFAGDERGRWKGCTRIDVRDLTQRMNAGVRPSRAVRLELVGSQRVAQGAVQLALHGPGVLLNLPAAVARPGVFDGEFVSWHTSVVECRRAGF